MATDEKINCMIKANELRIGNLVYWQTFDVLPVNFINKEIVNIQEIKPEYFPSEDWKNRFSPIPLTEEWLLGFGFYKSPSSNDVFLLIGKSMTFNVFIDSDCDEKIPNTIGYIVTAHINNMPHCGFAFYRESNVSHYHVHTLQNLYFALTGEELVYSG